MPADRPHHQPPPSWPFDEPRRSSTASNSSSSSSPATQHRSSAPSPCSTLDSDYPPTPPSFPHLAGSPHHPPQRQPFPRPQTHSSFFPGHPHQHQQHYQHAGPSRLGSDGLSRPRELSVGYDPGGGNGQGGGESMIGSFGGGGGWPGPSYSSSPGFTPQDLVIYGPSVEFGFKSPLPLPLLLESRTPAPALLEPYFHSPVSPAPPFYPNYQGPPVFEDPSRPSQIEVQSWESESEGGQPASERTLQMDAPMLYRSTATTDCKRCREHGVNCAWPGSEGVGACSNCFFSYSLCENASLQPLDSLSNFPFGQSFSSARNDQDGERTPTQSPLLRPAQRSALHPSFPFGLPSASSSSASSPSRSALHIPISFLLSEPAESASSSHSSGSSGPASHPPSSNLGRRSTSSDPFAGLSHSHDLVEGEMTELFGRVVKLQSEANASLGQVVEKLRSPSLTLGGGSELPSISPAPLTDEQEDKRGTISGGGKERME